MKKTVHIALCTMIILGCKIPSASGGETTGQLTKFGTITEEPVSEQEGLTWSFDGNTLTIGGTGVMPDYGSDDRAPWYGYRYNITRVIIKQGVKNIGAGAFSGCASLPSITIPSSVTTIGGAAFYDCSSLTSITIPNSVTTIGSSAFFGCSSLTSVSIGNSVTTIGHQAFDGCSNLTSITIPNSVTTIGARAFSGCIRLRNVVVLRITPPPINSGNGVFDTFFDVPLSSVTLTVPKWCGEAYKNARGWENFGLIIEVGEPVGDRTPFTWELDGGTLTIGGTREMPDYSSESSPWYNDRNNITRVDIKQGVKSIGNYAFAACHSLTSITIPNSVTKIGALAFEGCSSLRNVVVLRTTPPSITSGGGFFDTFYQCPLSSATLTVPQGCRSAYQSAKGWNEFGMIVEAGGGGTAEPLTWSLDGGMLTISGKGMKMPEYSFRSSPWYNDRNNITTVNIQDGVTTIGTYAFTSCSSLTSITIPNSVTTIGGAAFYGCSSLTSITIPNSVTTIGSGAFYGCSSLTSITIPNSVTTIGERAFYRCSSLTSITIPNSVTTIGERAFYRCSSLTSITIPNSVTTIGEVAFYECSSLRNIVVLKRIPPVIDDDNFSLSSATLAVPKGCKAAYQSATGWKNFGTIVELEN